MKKKAVYFCDNPLSAELPKFIVQSFDNLHQAGINHLVLQSSASENYDVDKGSDEKYELYKDGSEEFTQELYRIVGEKTVIEQKINHELLQLVSRFLDHEKACIQMIDDAKERGFEIDIVPENSKAIWDVAKSYVDSDVVFAALIGSVHCRNIMSFEKAHGRNPSDSLFVINQPFLKEISQNELYNPSEIAGFCVHGPQNDCFASLNGTFVSEINYDYY